MTLLSSPRPLVPQGVCLALGMFDGVHLGHQHVVRQARLDARATGAASVILTFDPHPLAVIAPDRAPKLLQSVTARVQALGDLGVDAVLLQRFDATTRDVTGEAFIRQLAQGFGRIRSLTVGEGFQFGRGRSGDVPLLERLGSELDFQVHAAAPIRIGDDVVSSTRIRAALRSGDLAQAGQLLGRPYALSGVVQAGDRVGHTLGFPTANLPVEGLELPPFGVYAVRVLHRGREWLGALNLGRRPTLGLDQPPVRCEVHLLDFSGDLYGEELRVEFVAALRGEQRFDGLDALRAQIGRDIAEVRSRLA